MNNRRSLLKYILTMPVIASFFNPTWGEVGGFKKFNGRYLEIKWLGWFQHPDTHEFYGYWAAEEPSGNIFAQRGTHALLRSLITGWEKEEDRLAFIDKSNSYGRFRDALASTVLVTDPHTDAAEREREECLNALIGLLEGDRPYSRCPSVKNV